jgi:ubiquinone/menaquinone biosynthesis C-methylase UbiE
MKKAEYSRMAEREKTYWWHIGRLQIIQSYLEKGAKNKKDNSLLNIGCGTGGTIGVLERFGTVDNVDISDDAIKYMKKHGYDRLTKVDGIELPFKDKRYDILGAFDVLEHIDDHIAALKEWRRVLKDDGAIVLTVPAYQWLWSDHDVSLHHKRRYTIKRLSEAAKQADLKIDRKSYAIVFSLPLVVTFRFLNKVSGRKTGAETSYVDVPDWVNSLFAKFLGIEANMHKIMSFPAGTSVVAILRKDNV